LESLEQRRVPHRDFYNVRKVDVHIHHSAVMTQKHLLRFMKHKLKRCSDEIVMERHEKFWSLKQVFESLGLSAYDLSIDYLDMHADDTMHRFDRFNLKYNPVGESRLREVFLKPTNLIEGRYLAEVTKQVFRDLEENKYVLIEPRVSVYGKSRNEWDLLGKWYCANKLASPNVRWMVQVPRLFHAFRAANATASFQDLLDNVFQPLFECTLRPDLHPELDCFLNQVVGIDCVDDESVVESFNPDVLRLPPDKWTMERDPPYVYWMYYLWSSLRVLNALRQELHRTTISFRPHAGETGELLHLSSTFLVAESINHGIMLRKSPSLQYLYYLAQIGLAMSPLSNNRLFLDYHSNPFPIFFARGLNVALSTDDPLLLHVTKDPLVEEYSVASQVWKLSSTDVCEVARNSVLMSGLEHPFKAHFIGHDFFLPGVAGNDIACTNVPDVRVQYRYETLEGEMEFVRHTAAVTAAAPPAR
jgi:AMP deaminase